MKRFSNRPAWDDNEFERKHSQSASHSSSQQTQWTLIKWKEYIWPLINVLADGIHCREADALAMYFLVLFVAPYEYLCPCIWQVHSVLSCCPLIAKIRRPGGKMLLFPSAKKSLFSTKNNSHLPWSVSFRFPVPFLTSGPFVLLIIFSLRHSRSILSVTVLLEQPLIAKNLLLWLANCISLLLISSQVQISVSVKLKNKPFIF